MKTLFKVLIIITLSIGIYSKCRAADSSASLKLESYVMPHVYVTQTGSIVTNAPDTKMTIVKETINDALVYTVTAE